MQEAADLLLVSRPFVVKLLGEGEIAHHRVGSRRFMRLEDVLAYRERQARVRSDKLDELARLSEGLPGGYR